MNRVPIACIACIVALLCLSRPPRAIAEGAAGSDSVGPAFQVGGVPVFGPAVEYQIDAAVAFDGTDYMTVWSDYRSGTSFDILGARVGPDGTLLDEASLIISAADGQQEDPAIAFDGVNHLVVWVDARSGPEDIYATRLSPSGDVLDPAGIPVSTAAGGQAEVAVSFGDSAYLVVWTDLRDGNQNIYGARVMPDGTVLDPAGIAICTDGASQRYPAVAREAGGWLVVWQDARNSQPDIYGARVDASGAVLDASGIAVAATSADETYPAVTGNGVECLAVWDVDAGTTSRDIYATRVDTSGNVLDPSGIVVCNHPAYQGYPAAGSDGSGYLVLWDDYRNEFTWDVYGARVDSAGALVDTTSLPICLDPSQQFGLAVAFGASNWLVCWHDSRNDHKDIFGIRVLPDGSTADPAAFLVSSSALDQSAPALAFDGAAYLAVWHEWRESTGYDIRGARVTADGSVVDPTGISICSGASDAMYPDIAFDGTNYLVVWQDYRSGAWDIYAARVSTDGAVIDPSAFAINVSADAQEYPAVTFNGTKYLVVWQDRRNGNYDIYGARVSPSGTVHEPGGRVISAGTRGENRPAAASCGTAYFVVWEDARNVYSDVYGARLDAGGEVIDSSGIAICTRALQQERPGVVFDGRRYAVVWQDRRSNSTYDVYLARVDTSATVLDAGGILVSGAAGDQKSPSVAFDNRDYFLAWSDGRGAAGLDIYGAHVDTSGAVLDPAGFEVSGADYDQVDADVSSTSFGLVLVTYSSFSPPPEYTSYRIWANFYDMEAAVGDAPPGSPPLLLYPNYPNPFSTSTILRFHLPRSGHVSLSVYDVRGRHIATLLDGPAPAGFTEIEWDARAGGGAALAPGLYFCRLTSGSSCETRKMVLGK